MPDATQLQHRIAITGGAILHGLDYNDREVDGGPGICVGLSQGPGICVGLSGPRDEEWEAPTPPQNMDSRFQHFIDYANDGDNLLPYEFTTTCC